MIQRMALLPAKHDLWALVRGNPSVDPTDLLEAMNVELLRTPHDFRTRLLLRDSFSALEEKWGREAMLSRLSSVAASALLDILNQNLGEPGFPSLQQRIMERIDPETILQFLRELGSRIPQRVRLDIGGSGALILGNFLARNTEDIDAVNEIPPTLRDQHDLLNSLAVRYGLRLAHFQSHYLPKRWEERVRSLERFRNLDVFLVDEYDILLSKLFSSRTKDLDDLRMLLQRLERSTVESRLLKTCELLLAEPALHANAERNWFILFGDKLPA